MNVTDLLKSMNVTHSIGRASLLPQPDAIVTFPMNLDVVWTSDPNTYFQRYGHKIGGQPIDPSNAADTALYTRGNIREELFGAVFGEIGLKVIREMLGDRNYLFTAQDFEDLRQAAEPGPNPSRSFIEAEIWDKVKAAIDTASATSGTTSSTKGAGTTTTAGAADTAGTGSVSGDISSQVAQLQSTVNDLKSQLASRDKMIAVAKASAVAIINTINTLVGSTTGGGRVAVKARAAAHTIESELTN